jgi:membrane protein DedA with SNARE-associated domain
VIAAGAFARQGFLSWQTTASISIVSVVIGDAISYSLGYYSREYVLRRFSGTPRWLQAEQSFQKWGPLSIFFSRFLVTALALPVNLLSGTTRFPFAKFLLFDVLGETVWVMGYGGLGYIFSSQWETVSQIVSDFGGLLLGLILLVIGIQLGRRWLAVHKPVRVRKE